MSSMNPKLKNALVQARRGSIVFLTGAGVSAESGIPTFRGQDGYWTVGSSNYRPEDLATRRAFAEVPDDVWGWYLFRRTVCNRAQPSRGHLLLVKLETELKQRFLLVTQNVDGLHLRSGNSRERTHEVHGDINFMRCWKECSTDLYPIPEEVGAFARGDKLESRHRALLACPRCSGLARPHVLWFDECYDEARFRFESSLTAALSCRVLVSIGSSGSTNLPTQMVRGAVARGATLIDINLERGPYASLAQSSGGFWLKVSAGEGLAQVAEALSIAV